MLNTVSTRPAPAVATVFATVGFLQCQVRQLLNSWPHSECSDDRPVAFCLADGGLGVLPPKLQACAWVHLDQATEEQLLVLPATDGTTAAFVIASLADRRMLLQLENALGKGRIELVVASPGGATSHWLEFSPKEEECLEALVSEHLELHTPYESDWLDDLSATAQALPRFCAHLHPALPGCERHIAIALQGTSENHIRAIRTAVRYTAA